MQLPDSPHSFYLVCFIIAQKDFFLLFFWLKKAQIVQLMSTWRLSIKNFLQPVEFSLNYKWSFFWFPFLSAFFAFNLLQSFIVFLGTTSSIVLIPLIIKWRLLLGEALRGNVPEKSIRLFLGRTFFHSLCVLL